MPQDDFQRRLERLGAKTAAEAPAPEPASAPQAPAGTRKEKLRRALDALERAGVRGNHAYSPVFRGLARVGLGPKPLFYGSWIGLFLFSFVLFFVAMGGAIMLAISMDAVRGPIRRMIEAGPTVFIAMITVLSMLHTAYHKVRARRMNLPRWRDL